MITEQQFQAYEDVRESGVTNMYDVKMVEQLSDLTIPQIREIMKNYDSLCKKYPNVREIE